MEIKNLSLLTLEGIWLLALVGAPTAGGQEPLRREILKWSEDDQISWLNSTLALGLPPDLDGALYSLTASKSSLTLPVIEKRIEEVLKSNAPTELFTDKSVDPQKFIALAVSTIEYLGNEPALRECAKLLHLDEKRFDSCVQRTLINAEDFRNPFLVAYQGLAIGDPALEARIAGWAEAKLSDKEPPPRNFGPRDPVPKTEFEIQQTRQSWAEALVDEYSGVLTDTQWRSDPIASRLTPSRAESLHNDMIRRTSEIIEKRTTR